MALMPSPAVLTLGRRSPPPLCSLLLLILACTEPAPKQTASAPSDMADRQAALRSSAEARIESIPLAAIPKLSDQDLGELINWGQGSQVFGWMDSANAEQQRRKDRVHLAKVFEAAKALTFDDGSRCSKASEARTRKLVTAHPDWSDEVLVLVICGGIQVGMTADQLRESWGKPEEINSTVTASSSHDQWVYGSRRYVYVRDGTVTSWQFSH